MSPHLALPTLPLDFLCLPSPVPQPLTLGEQVSVKNQNILGCEWGGGRSETGPQHHLSTFQQNHVWGVLTYSRNEPNEGPL